MMMDKEYRDAFNADDEVIDKESLDGEALADDVADNATDETAAEGAGEEGSAPDATAVTLTTEEEGEGADDASEAEETLSPEEEQRKRSWEGRLKKREEELAAREAALADRDSPAMLADGGEVEGEEALAAEGGMAESEPVAAEGEAGEATEGGDAGLFDTLMGEAREIAGSAERLEAKIAQDVEDYGRDYVTGYMAMAMRMANAVAEPHIAAFEADLGALVDDVSDAFRSMHKATIADAHDDFEEIVSGEEFQAFIEGLPDEEKAKAAEVVERGSSGQIIKLLQRFKDSLKQAKEPSPEDIWAEDAAAGVRGSAPVKLPTRAPASPDDEYKRAWDAA